MQGSPVWICHKNNSPKPTVVTTHFRRIRMSLSLAGLPLDEVAIQRLGVFRLSPPTFCLALQFSLQKALLSQDTFQVIREVIAFECMTTTLVMSSMCFSHTAPCSFTGYVTRLINLTLLWDGCSPSCLVVLSFSGEKTYPFHSSLCSVIADGPLQTESTSENHGYLGAKGPTISYRCS